MDERAAKARLRAEMKGLRAALTPVELAAGAERAAARLQAEPAWRQARTVCLYASFRQELGTGPLLGAALQQGKRLVLPRARADGTLGLHAVVDLTGLRPNHLGIPEPTAADPVVTPGEIDLFLVPGLAFDEEGRRLGYGAGFYDRLLAQARRDAACLGYGYDFQVSPEVPTEPHDQKLGMIVTPERCLRARTA